MNQDSNEFNYVGEVIFVTPGMAASWLETHASFQRPLSDKKVKEWVLLMRTGRWTLTHQGVAITEKGEILDGQHRLAAIKECNTGQLMVVVKNADPSTFSALDRGYTRSNISVLKMGGSTISSAKISALNTLLWDASIISSIGRTWSVYDIDAVAEYFSLALDASFHSSSKFGGGYIRGAGVRAIASNPAHAEKVKRFYEVLATGASTSPAEVPIVFARNKLGRFIGAGRETRWAGHWIVCHALKSYLSGSIIKHESNVGSTTFMNGGAKTVFPTFIDEFKGKSYMTWEKMLAANKNKGKTGKNAA